MNQIQERRLWKPTLILTACSILALIACGGTGGADSESADEAAVPTPSATGSEASEITCKTGGYVLCIAASCVSTPGSDGKGTCGVYTESGAACDETGVNDGSCGACYYFESEDGDSSTYHRYFPDSSVQTLGAGFGEVYTSCGDLSSQADVVSTYSNTLVTNFDFVGQDLSCTPTPFTTANCMGAACTATGLTIPIANGTTGGTTTTYPTYTCECLLDTDAVDGTYENFPLGNQPDCDATWSVGG